MPNYVLFLDDSFMEEVLSKYDFLNKKVIFFFCKFNSVSISRQVLGNLTLPFCSSPSWHESLMTSCLGARTYDLVRAEASVDDLADLAKWAVLVGSPGEYSN